jgi:hypothetical protein
MRKSLRVGSWPGPLPRACKEESNEQAFTGRKVVLIAGGGIGLSHGYSVRAKLVVHLFLFGIPALAAWLAGGWPGSKHDDGDL